MQPRYRVGSVRHTLASVFLVLAASGPAVPAIPTRDQLQIKALLVQTGAPDLALVPTSLPSHYVFESFSVTGSPLSLDVSLRDQRSLKIGAQAKANEISFDTVYFKGGCSSGSRRTLRVGGSMVYNAGTSVWRCVRTSRGRLVKESAHGPLAATELAVLVVSASPVR